MNYDVGDSVKLAAAFTNEAGVAADPTDLTGTVRTPTGAETGYVLADFTHPSAGVYELTVVATEGGVWTWRIAGTGAVTAAAEGKFCVRESSF